jgi:hypothetical protein
MRSQQQQVAMLQTDLNQAFDSADWGAHNGSITADTGDA